MLNRLRTDFHLSVITLLGLCAIVGVLPFAIYRFIAGLHLTGMIDTAIVASVVFAVFYAWKTGDTARTGLFLAIVTCGGAVVATHVGVAGLYWLFPTLLTSFFLVRPSIAIVVNALAIAILASDGDTFVSNVDRWTFVASCLVVSLCAFIFAQRTESQRMQLEKLATRDPLTGTHNRRVMETELKQAVSSQRQTEMSFGLIMLDLDHFKQINDSYGHNVGDQVLIQLSKLVLDCTRRADYLFRFGGEEFVLLLAGTDVSGMRAVAENIRQRIQAELKSPGGPVTASLGGALLAPNESWMSWLKRADAALYQAKAKGRNCVIIDTGEAPLCSEGCHTRPSATISPDAGPA